MCVYVLLLLLFFDLILVSRTECFGFIAEKTLFCLKVGANRAEIVGPWYA